jgi:prevent-host-death family protein
MDITVTQFKATCLGVIDKVQKEKSRVTITRHGKPAAELIPISSSSPGKLFGRSKGSTFIFSDLLSSEENWDAED